MDLASKVEEPALLEGDRYPSWLEGEVLLGSDDHHQKHLYKGRMWMDEIG